MKVEGQAFAFSPQILPGLEITEDTVSTNYQGRSLLDINQLRVFSGKGVSPLMKHLDEQIMSQQIDSIVSRKRHEMHRAQNSLHNRATQQSSQ
jgi:hypothetical protein